MATIEFGRPKAVGEWMLQSNRLRPPAGSPFCVKYVPVGVGITGMLLGIAAFWVSREGNEPLHGVVGEAGAVSGLGTDTLRDRNAFEVEPALSKPSGAEGILPIGRAGDGRGGSPGSSSARSRALELKGSPTEPTEGSRLEGCKVARGPDVEDWDCSEGGSSLGRGGGGRLVKGVEKDRLELLESARGRALVSIVSSVGFCLESLCARTPGTGGGPTAGGGGALVRDIRCAGREGKSEDAGIGGSAADGGEEGRPIRSGF